MSQPIAGTLVETYLRGRGITALHGSRQPALPSALLLSARGRRADRDLAGYDRRRHRSRRPRSPARIAPGSIRQARDKAPVDTPRRAMGHLLGHGVRFGVASDVMAAGEGIETMLSLRCVMPTMPMVAALSASHLAAILFPPTLRRLYIARDDDPAGDGAVAGLLDTGAVGRDRGDRAVAAAGRLQRGSARSSASTRFVQRCASQLAPEDVARFMTLDGSGRG